MPEPTPLIPQALGMEDDRSLQIVRAGAVTDQLNAQTRLYDARAKVLGAWAGLITVASLAVLVATVLAAVLLALHFG